MKIQRKIYWNCCKIVLLAVVVLILSIFLPVRSSAMDSVEKTIDMTSISQGPLVYLPMMIEGVEQTLELTEVSVFATDARVLLVSNDTIVEDRPPSGSIRAFRGKVQNQPGSATVVTISPHQVIGTVILPSGEAYSIANARNHENQLVLLGSRATQESDPGLGFCGTVPAESRAIPQGRLGGKERRRSRSALSIATPRIAIDTDFAVLVNSGFNTFFVEQKVLTILAGVNSIYTRDVDITFVISHLVIRTTPGTYDGSQWDSDDCDDDGYYDIVGLLWQLRDWWNDESNGLSSGWNHVQLFTGKDIFDTDGGTKGEPCGAASYNTLGVANMGFIYEGVASPGMFGISEIIGHSTDKIIGVVSHEIGHNYSAPHCNEVDPEVPSCNLMCETYSGCDGLGPLPGEFGSFSQSVITDFAALRTDLGWFSSVVFVDFDLTPTFIASGTIDDPFPILWPIVFLGTSALDLVDPGGIIWIRSSESSQVGIIDKRVIVRSWDGSAIIGK